MRNVPKKIAQTIRKCPLELVVNGPLVIDLILKHVWVFPSGAAFQNINIYIYIFIFYIYIFIFYICKVVAGLGLPRTMESS